MSQPTKDKEAAAHNIFGIILLSALISIIPSQCQSAFTPKRVNTVPEETNPLRKYSPNYNPSYTPPTDRSPDGR